MLKFACLLFHLEVKNIGFTRKNLNIESVKAYVNLYKIQFPSFLEHAEKS
jgi:hypothetical protein